MDTRSKIVNAAEAAKIAGAGATVVSGYFDPMIAWHATWLNNFKKADKPMLVLIAAPDNAILPSAARAELVAALRIVDFVAESTPELSAIAGVIHVEAQDRELFQDLLELVHTRNRAAAASS